VNLPVLNTLELNRALLARQLLLERSSRSSTACVERISGLQTQYAPSAYIGMWTRQSGFTRQRLTRALESRRLVQGTLMRGTIHVVSRRDYSLFAAGVSRTRREWWLRAARARGIDEVDYQEAASVLRTEMAEGPRQRGELIAALARAGIPKEAWEGAGMWVDMVRVPPSGTWERRRADRYGLAEDWLGASHATETEGLTHLCRRYLGGFGPATLGDLSSWSGIPATTLRPVLEAMSLRRFRSETDEDLLDLPRAPLPGMERSAPVRFLPTWDAVLLAHARRTQVLPEEYREMVFHTKNPQSVPTFLVEGRVAGSWRHENGRIVLTPFAPLPRAVRRDLEEESPGLAALHA
jgi:hypothetical protein